MNSTKYLFAFLVFCICLSVKTSLGAVGWPTVDDKGWTEDVAKAFEIAQKEKKDILMLFTGSDWCPPCQKLESEILSKEDFLDEASKRFVLLKLDFPRNSEQEPAITDQNQKWSKEFGVNSFPTIYLLDQNGKPFAIAGYEEGGLENYLGMLEESRQVRILRDEKMSASEDKEGADRAKLLDEAITGMRPEIVELYYPEIVAEIINIDKDDSLGLRTKWNSAEEAEIRKAILADVMTIARLEKPERAAGFIDEILKEFEFPIQQKMEILNVKLNLIRQLGDPGKVDQLLESMIAMEGVTRETQDRLLVKRIFLLVGAKQTEEAWKLLDESLKTSPNSLYLLKAKGDLHESKKEFAEAVKAYSQAIPFSNDVPDLMIELVSAQADAQLELGQEVEAMDTLDRFIDNQQRPADLRAQALLHKSVILRERKRIRQARLAENKAVEVVQSAQQKRELQKMVESLRAKYGD